VAPLSTDLNAISILPEIITAKNAVITSVSNQNFKTVGYEGQDNTLEISYTPVTMMSKGGLGKIEIHLPQWYSLDTER
jgi:hypothetical protein